MLAAVLDHLWQSTLLALGLGLLTWAFRKAKAEVRHGLWFAASMKFLVPFAGLAMLGRLLAPLGLAPAPQEAVLIQKATAPLSRFPFDRTVIPSSPIAVSDLSPVPLPSSPHIAPAVHAATHVDLGLILLALWGAGCLAVLIRWMIRWARIRAIVRAATPLAWAAPMPVLASPFLQEPGLIGFLRPVLVIPETLPDHLTRSEIAAIVAHEACHLRRRDNLTAAAHMLAEAVVWFHPLVWWIGARLIEERERACDEAVVRAGHDRAVYARSLVESCRLYLQSPLSCVAGASGSDLTARVTLIMTGPPSSPLSSASKAMLGVVGLCALAMPIGAGLLTAPTASLGAVARAVALATPARVLQTVMVSKIEPVSAPGPVVSSVQGKGGAAAAIILARDALLPAADPSGAEAESNAELSSVALIPSSQTQAAQEPRLEPAVVQQGQNADALAATPVSNTVAALTVQAAPGPKAIRLQTRSFVRSLASAANPEAGQIARWRDPICVRVAGLPDGQEAAIKARIEDVARSLDVRVQPAGCVANIQVMFTAEPQALMDSVAKQHEYMLGYYHRHDRDQLKKVVRPIQAWYVTATENNDPLSAAVGQTFVGGGANHAGRGVIDDPDQLSPPGCADAPQIRSCRRSLISNVFVVADAKAIQGQDAGLIADYVVMLTLAQPRSLDGCNSLASVLDLLARNACAHRDAPTGLTASDAAYLTSLYKADLETRRNFAEADISDRMAQLLIKAWVPSSRQ